MTEIQQIGPFPEGDNIDEATEGELILSPGTLVVGSQTLAADYGTLVVKEDRSNPASRLIRLPVLRVRAAKREDPLPLFSLRGGPGDTNIARFSPWFFEGRDVVMVGYRGVDGSVSLDAPEVADAITSTGDPLSRESIARLGKAMLAAFRRLESEGISLDNYTMVDVAEDIDDARRALGYDCINLWGHSYGCHVAHIYGLCHPEHINRTFISGSTGPNALALWEPEAIAHVLRRYAEIWEGNPHLVKRAPDLLDTMRTVLSTLPITWNGVTIDPGKVRMMTFLQLYNNGTAAQVFDAYVSAYEGDYAGLAFLSTTYDQVMGGLLNWGDTFSKIYSSSDVYSRLAHTIDNPNPDTVIGLPLSMWLMQAPKYGGWPIRKIPESYRMNSSSVETLILNGGLDISSPLGYARRNLLPRLSRGHLIVLETMGHHDLYNLQEDAYRHMLKVWLTEGVVDTSRFIDDAPIDLIAKPKLGDLARLMREQ
jgi:pimeloyl-ACP methyl ester carboxylesterase